MLEFSSTESCSTGATSSPLSGFSSNVSSCDGNVALINDFESTGGCSSQGPQGPQGFSAYQIAVFEGFVGTEEEWLASLVGPQGPVGPIGPQGPIGLTGPGVPVGGTIGQILAKIDSTNYNTQWINNFALPALTSGSVLFSNGTTIAQDNSNFFFDNINKRLGIGTNIPTSTLYIKGAGNDATTNSLTIINSLSRNLINIRDDGRFDIGSTLTVATININSSGENRIKLFSTAEGTDSLQFYTNGGAYGSSYGEFGYLFKNTATQMASINFDTRTSVAPFRFFVNPTGASAIDAMDIFRTGEVGIGTSNTNNGGKLQIKVGGSAVTDIALRVRNSGNTADLFAVFGNNTTVIGNSYGATKFGSGGFGYLSVGIAGEPIVSLVSNVQSSTQTLNGVTIPIQSSNLVFTSAYGYDVGNDYNIISVGKFGIKVGNTTSAIQILSNGNVGINTLTPAIKLDVRGGFNIYSDTSNHYLEATSVSSTDGTLNFRRSGNANGWLRLQLGGLQIASDNGSGECRILASSGGYFPTFYSNGVERLRISTTGLLQLDGTTNLFPAIKRNGTAIDFKLADDSGFCDIRGKAINGNSIVCLSAGGVGISQISNLTTYGFHMSRNFVVSWGSNTQIDGSLDTAIARYSANVVRISNASTGGGNLFIGASTGYNASAVLQADSTTQGFLPPRMTNAQRLAIATPAIGLIVYCTDVVEGLYINKSSGWAFVV